VDLKERPGSSHVPKKDKAKRDFNLVTSSGGPTDPGRHVSLKFKFLRVLPLSRPLMTHKYRGCIVVLSINKSVEPNEEQKVLTSGFDQGFTVNTSKRVFRGNW
jgi:hypothetical protein